MTTTPRWRAPLTWALVGLLALTLAGPAAAQEDERVLRFQFKNADLQTVLAAMSKSLGFTFIQGSGASLEGKKLTAVSDKSVPRAQAISFLNSALITHGVVAVEVGAVVKIVTIEEAKKINHSINYGGDPEAVPFGDEIITQIVPLSVLSAEVVKKELQELTSDTGQFLLNTTANVILLTDTQSNVKRFLTIIHKLDKAVQETLKIELFRLKHANASELAQAIERLFQPIESSGGNNRGGRGRGGRGGGDFRQMIMQRMMGGGGGNNQGTALRSTVVRTTVEERSNTLIVQANESTMEQVKGLVTKLDTSEENVVAIRPYPLEFAEAAQVAQVVRTVFEPEQPSGGRNNRGGGGGGRFQQMMRMMQQRGGGQASSATAPSEQIKVTHDERTNAVVVAASEMNHELVATLIESLDRKVDPDQEVRIYNLENADAEELKRILDEIFSGAGNTRGAGGNNRNNARNLFNRGNQGRGNQGRGNQGRNNRGNQRRGGGGGRGGDEGDEDPKKADQPEKKDGPTVTFTPGGEVKVSQDSRTNSLVITAAKDDFEAVERIIRQLDSDNADLESTLVIKLLNGNATSMQQLLQNLFGNNDGRGQGGGNNARPGQTSSAVGGLTGQVNVRADEESNSLVFVTASRNFDTLRRLVAELDAERPQVLIKALIVEVDLDDNTELGVEWSGNETTREGRDSERTDTLATDFDVAAAENGFTWNQVRIDDKQILLRALRQDGKLSVLSAPRILVQDNEEGSFNVGQEVPYVTNSRLTNEGTTLNTIQYRELGILLTVTPSINPQGLVKMVLEQEISQIAPDSQSVQITEGVRSPVFLRNVANTTVTIRDGQTIVLGGLIQDRTRETADKVPILGDIPLLGYFFSSRSTETAKVELLIFITPYVVNQADELRQLTASEIRNFKLLPSRAVMHRTMHKMPTVILDD